MGLCILAGGNPVAEIVVPALDDNPAGLRHRLQILRKLVVVLHPDEEIVQLVLRHPVEQLRRLLIEWKLLDESAALQERAARGHNNPVLRESHLLRCVEPVAAWLEETVSAKAFRQVVDTVERLDRRRRGNDRPAVDAPDFKGREPLLQPDFRLKPVFCKLALGQRQRCVVHP